jgi:transcription antitermination factor NusG
MVKTRVEKNVSRLLEPVSSEVFLPVHYQVRNWSDRRKVVEVPLFPGYVFCRIDPTKRLPVLQIPGVLKIVSDHNGPAAVKDAEIASLQRAVRSGLSCQPTRYLQTGEVVIIKNGPLLGMEGIFVEWKGKSNVILSVSLLQRSVAVEVERDSVARLGLAMRAAG